MPDFDTSVPHIARVYDYWLGGKDNFAADREARRRRPCRPTRHLVELGARQPRVPRPGRPLPGGDAGIRQFLDIGTGIPAASNTHEVAQRVAPDSRIVYVDNDPIVLAHARALLTSTPRRRVRLPRRRPARPGQDPGRAAHAGLQ